MKHNRKNSISNKNFSSNVINKNTLCRMLYIIVSFGMLYIGVIRWLVKIDNRILYQWNQSLFLAQNQIFWHKNFGQMMLKQFASQHTKFKKNSNHLFKFYEVQYISGVVNPSIARWKQEAFELLIGNLTTCYITPHFRPFSRKCAPHWLWYRMLWKMGLFSTSRFFEKSSNFWTGRGFGSKVLVKTYRQWT